MLLFILLSHYFAFQPKLISLQQQFSNDCGIMSTGTCSFTDEALPKLLLEIDYEPHYNVSSVENVFRTKYCTSRFLIVFEGYWSLSMQHALISGDSVLYGDRKENTYAGIEASLIVGRLGEEGTRQSASIYFSNSNKGPYSQEIQVTRENLENEYSWSSCSDSLMINFDSSIVLDSTYSGRFLSIFKKEVVFSFRRCVEV
jgi:hypothetical protein